MSGKIRTYKDLIVWQKAVELVVAVYEVTGAFPDSEKFGLVNQLRRAAVSVPSNIAEGYGRGSTNDYLRFLKIAAGSCNEIETQIEIAHRLEYMTIVHYKTLCENIKEINKMLATVIRKITANTHA